MNDLVINKYNTILVIQYNLPDSISVLLKQVEEFESVLFSLKVAKCIIIKLREPSLRRKTNLTGWGSSCSDIYTMFFPGLLNKFATK